MNYKKKQLRDVLSYSEKMLAAAESGNWNDVFHYETFRVGLLNELLALPFTAEERETNNNQIREILLINRHLECITAKVRKELNKQPDTIH